MIASGCVLLSCAIFLPVALNWSPWRLAHGYWLGAFYFGGLHTVLTGLSPYVVPTLAALAARHRRLFASVMPALLAAWGAASGGYIVQRLWWPDLGEHPWIAAAGVAATTILVAAAVSARADARRWITERTHSLCKAVAAVSLAIQVGVIVYYIVSGAELRPGAIVGQAAATGLLVGFSLERVSQLHRAGARPDEEVF